MKSYYDEDSMVILILLTIIIIMIIKMFLWHLTMMVIVLTLQRCGGVHVSNARHYTTRSKQVKEIRPDILYSERSQGKL